MMEVLHTIDIGKLWRIVKKNARKFAIVEGIAIVVALIYGFSIPRTYMSKMQLAPETSNNSLAGNLGSMASMLGMKMGNYTAEDAISPELYPDVKSSPDFLLSLFSIKVRTLDGKVNTDYRTYLLKHTRATWWDILIEKMRHRESDGQKVKGAADSLNAIYLSKDEYELMKGVDKLISCTVNKKTDVITIVVVDQDPLVATLMVDSVRMRLQKFITDYRTKKARNDVAYLEELFEKARSDYRNAQKEYAAFSDAHQELFLEKYKIENDNLENEVQIAYNVYSQITAQLQAAKAKVLERTPVYTVVEAPMIPVKHIAPRRSIILLMFMVLAFMGTFAWAYRKELRDSKKLHAQQQKTEAPTTEN